MPAPAKKAKKKAALSGAAKPGGKSKAKPAPPPPDPEDAARLEALRQQVVLLHTQRDATVQATQLLRRQTEALDAADAQDKATLRSAKAETQAVDEQCRELERTHRDAVRAYQRRLRHQILQQEQEVAGHRIEAQAALQERWQAQQATTDAQRHKHRLRRIQAKAREAATLAAALDVQKQHAAKRAALVQEYEAKSHAVQQDHARQFDALRAAAAAQRQAEAAAVTQTTAKALNALKGAQEEALQDLKAYYHARIHAQHRALDAIQTQVLAARRKAQQDEKQLDQVQREHDEAFAYPLAKGTHVLAALEQAHDTYQAEKETLQVLQTQIRMKEVAVRRLTEQNAVLAESVVALQQQAAALRRVHQAEALKHAQRTGLIKLLQETTTADREAGVVWGA